MQINERDYDLADGSTTSALVLAIRESRQALILAITQMEELMRQGTFVHRDDDAFTAFTAVAPDPHRLLPRPDRVDAASAQVRISARRPLGRSGLRILESDLHKVPFVSVRSPAEVGAAQPA